MRQRETQEDGSWVKALPASASGQVFTQWRMKERMYTGSIKGLQGFPSANPAVVSIMSDRFFAASSYCVPDLFFGKFSCGGQCRTQQRSKSCPRHLFPGGLEASVCCPSLPSLDSTQGYPGRSGQGL